MPRKILVLLLIHIFVLFLNAKDGKVDKTGKISVTTVPAGLNLYIDGKPVGVTPVINLEVPAGNRIISVETEPCFKSVLFYSWNRSVFVEPDRETAIEIVPEPVMTSLKISSMEISGKEVTGQRVFVDRKQVGIQPGEFDVPACSKLLEIVDNSDNKVIYSSELDLLKGTITERKEKGYEIVTTEKSSSEKDPAAQTEKIPFAIRKSSSIVLKTARKERKITGPYKWIGTGLIIGGAVIAGLGGVFDYLAYTEFDEYEKMGDEEYLSKQISSGDFNKSEYLIKRDDLYTAGERYAIARTIMYVAGGASFVTGVILLFVPGKKKGKNAPVITAAPYQDGIFINAKINF
ncbi:MAG: PEGA domain-containing protein [bacterium]|jgi:hypothetical protein|nr:PEGA domain-containing protein [bacterium]